jgi:hypothetical protein
MTGGRQLAWPVTADIGCGGSDESVALMSRLVRSRLEGFGIEAADAPSQGLAMLGMGAIGDHLVEARLWPL